MLTYVWLNLKCVFFSAYLDDLLGHLLVDVTLHCFSISCGSFAIRKSTSSSCVDMKLSSRVVSTAMPEEGHSVCDNDSLSGCTIMDFADQPSKPHSS